MLSFSKILLILVILLTVLSGYSLFKIEALYDQNNNLNSQITSLTKQISQINNTLNLLSGKPVKHKIPVGDSVVLGNQNARVTIIKWTDFQCPYCARSTDLVEQILNKYPDDVRVVIKNFPIESRHKQAKQTAIYALAANKQGKYREFYKEVFKRFRELKSNPNLVFEITAQLNLDKEKLINDAKNPMFSKLIETEKQQLLQSGMRPAVPKFLINGQEPPSRDLNSWSTIIEEALKKRS